MSMYPDEQTVVIDGETVSWPGLKDGKFTSGDFADPAQKPSFIPAETINLLVDNISALIVKLGVAPNNTAVDQLAAAFSSAASANKAICRDASGRAKVAAPSASDDIARKAEVDTHAALTSPHSATSAATASRLVIRDASGRAKVAAPSAEDDIALKSNVTAEATARDSADDAHAALTAAGTHGSTVAATANRAMHRDGSGRSQVASPSADADVANKGWTRDFVYPVNSFYIQYPAASSNDDATEFPTAYRPATLFGGTWEEQWPTESVFFRTRGTLSDIGRANGMQEDAFQGHTFLSGTLSRPGGSGSGDTGMPNVIPVGGGVLGAITTDGINGPPRTAAETRTKNRHKKIWKRTA